MSLPAQCRSNNSPQSLRHEHHPKRQRFRQRIWTPRRRQRSATPVSPPARTHSRSNVGARRWHGHWSSSPRDSGSPPNRDEPPVLKRNEPPVLDVRHLASSPRTRTLPPLQRRGLGLSAHAALPVMHLLTQRSPRSTTRLPPYASPRSASPGAHAAPVPMTRTTALRARSASRRATSPHDARLPPLRRRGLGLSEHAALPAVGLPMQRHAAPATTTHDARLPPLRRRGLGSPSTQRCHHEASHLAPARLAPHPYACPPLRRRAPESESQTPPHAAPRDASRLSADNASMRAPEPDAPRRAPPTLHRALPTLLRLPRLCDSAARSPCIPASPDRAHSASPRCPVRLGTQETRKKTKRDGMGADETR
ncbi:hypothetical protein C8R44DRAFT_872311 [Mycena epipterygia]|nr:hypothetical protein C8R44DRAFT_872311 [Mycena epipterygia]